MEIPPNVVIVDETPELELLHYTDEAEHPSPASFWKGIVTDGHRIIARSFAWAPTEIESTLEGDENTVYTPFYEATLIRFFRYNGTPMASTHKRLNVMETNSRIGTGRPFKDLINEAINNWPYSERVIISPELPEGKVVSVPPSSWKDLCVEGLCHVFLLIDWSNQITDLGDTAEEIIVDPDTEKEELLSSQTPRLLYALSFRTNPETGDLEPSPFITPPVKLEEPMEFDDHGIINYKIYVVPRVPILKVEEAEKVLENDGAVIGFNPATPDVTCKYLSPVYARKVDLAGETFNPIHRWFELMDQDPEDANEYLDNLPFHHRDRGWLDMMNIYDQYTKESTQYLGNAIFDRYYGSQVVLDKRILTKASTILEDGLQALKQAFSQRKATKDAVRNKAHQIIRDLVVKLPYKDQHSLHGAIMRVKGGH